MPFTAAISLTRASPALLSTIVKLTSSPFGLSGQRSAFSLYSFSLMPQTRGRAADVVGARAAFRLEAHRGEPGLHFVGALDADEHDAAHAEVELLRDVLRRPWRDRARSRASSRTAGDGGARRRLRDHATFGHPLREVGERGIRAIEVAFHAAVEEVVGVACSLTRPSRARLAFSGGRCRRSRRTGRARGLRGP